MRIAFEATATARPVKSGVARYALQLIRALLDQGNSEDRYDAFYRLSRRFKKHHEPPNIDGVGNHWFLEPFPPLGGYDIVHGLDARVPSWPRVKRVATVHDLYMRPEDREKGMQRYHEVAKRCDRVITVSENTRRDFVEACDYPAERVHVVHLGVDKSFRPRDEDELERMRERLDLPTDYLLYAGEQVHRKNIVRMLGAYDRSEAATRYDLVIAGASEHKEQDIERAFATSPKHDRIRRMGYVADGDLQLLYAGAAAFLYPTLYEGFGLPVLEAFASRTPVLSSNTSSIPEIAGGYALLVNPEDEDAIAEGIDRVVQTTPRQLEAARAHAAHFSWTRCARQTHAVYHLLMDENSRTL